MSRHVALNALWNVGGALSSLLVGLVALPVLLHSLGEARLGVFTLALGLIGFSGLLDVGFGKALTQSVSTLLGQGRSRESVSALIWQVLLLLVAFGFFWLVVLWFCSEPLVGRVFKLHGELARETVLGLKALAVSLPFALVSTGAAGALEGLQRFRLVSTQRATLSILQFGLPALVSAFVPNLGWVIAALAASRMLGSLVWLRSLYRAMPHPTVQHQGSGDLRGLLHFGGWLSVSNLVGPLMVYADRFYLASVLPPAAVATYTVPYDTLFRATSLPTTAVAAVFPALAEAQSQPEKSGALVRMATSAMVSLMLPPMFAGLVFAKPLLSLWLGPDFAESSHLIFQILLVGVFVNSCANVPYALLQAHGRSDITAKIHIFELPLFVLVLVLFVKAWGIEGAAWAWSFRVTIDTVLLYLCSCWLFPAHRDDLVAGALAVLAATGALLLGVFIKAPIVLAALAALVLAGAVLQLRRLLALRWGRKAQVEKAS